MAAADGERQRMQAVLLAKYEEDYKGYKVNMCFSVVMIMLALACLATSMVFFLGSAFVWFIPPQRPNFQAQLGGEGRPDLENQLGGGGGTR